MAFQYSSPKFSEFAPKTKSMPPINWHPLDISEFFDWNAWCHPCEHSVKFRRWASSLKASIDSWPRIAMILLSSNMEPAFSREGSSSCEGSKLSGVLLECQKTEDGVLHESHKKGDGLLPLLHEREKRRLHMEEGVPFVSKAKTLPSCWLQNRRHCVRNITLLSHHTNR